MSANQGSLKVTKSCSLGKSSLMGNLLHGELEMRERWSTTTFSMLFYLNFEIEFLKEEDPTNESGLGFLLHHEVPKRRMIGENYGFGPK